MKLLVATDAHIFETADGKHWTPAIYGYSFWLRYLNVFDSVRIVARTKKISKLSGKELLVDGPGVEIYPLPFYQGPRELIKVYARTHKVLMNVANGCDVALFRLPSQTAQMAYYHVKGKLPIGGEIVYDPTDDLKNKKLRLGVRLLSTITSYNLKKFCKEANGVSYVTKETIQRNYPSAARIFGESSLYFETYYSTITLYEKSFGSPRNYKGSSSLKLCLSDVAMNSERKGERILINAVKQARERGYDISAIIIGDGTMRSVFEELSKKLNLSEAITFTGRLASADEVRKVLETVDMFVFPTQAEGLPRGILEAMALGLPVLSTPVGGIPEVIDSKYLFAPDDAEGFADMICHLVKNQDELTQMSADNFKKACEFSNTILQRRRDLFYKKLLDLRS